MSCTLMLVGDVNLRGISESTLPFAEVIDELHIGDIAFCNLECLLYEPQAGQPVERGQLLASPPTAGAALREAGFDVVGLANNVNYGGAAILASIERLDELGIRHTGAGANARAAERPAIVERKGMRIGFVQRSAIYWPSNHEATADAPGIGVLRAHTSYQLPMHRAGGSPPLNRPGIPPIVHTWADAAYLASFVDEITKLKAEVDVVVVSCHWGIGSQVLAYMREIARAAIEAGADIVIGHGPHQLLPIEFYKERPILYGLGVFSFRVAMDGTARDDWLGMMVRFGVEKGRAARIAFRIIRPDARHQSVISPPADELELKRLIEESASRGAELRVVGDEVVVDCSATASR